MFGRFLKKKNTIFTSQKQAATNMCECFNKDCFFLISLYDRQLGLRFFPQGFELQKADNKKKQGHMT